MASILQQLSWCEHTKKALLQFQSGYEDAFNEVDKALVHLEDGIFTDFLTTLFTNKEELKDASKILDEYINDVALDYIQKQINEIESVLAEIQKL